MRTMCELKVVQKLCTRSHHGAIFGKITIDHVHARSTGYKNAMIRAVLNREVDKIDISELPLPLSMEHHATAVAGITVPECPGRIGICSGLWFNGPLNNKIANCD